MSAACSAAIAEKNLTKYEWGKEVAPGITAIDTQRPYAGPYLVHDRVGIGQAPGTGRCDRRHVALLFVRNPDWFGGGDMDGPRPSRPGASSMT